VYTYQHVKKKKAVWRRLWKKVHYSKFSLRINLAHSNRLEYERFCWIWLLA